jgi:plastocyanin
MNIKLSFKKHFPALLTVFVPCLFCPLSGMGAVANVSVGNDFFSPATTNIHAGDQVIWTWQSGSDDHNVVSTSSLRAWLFPSPGGGPGTTSNQNNSNLRDSPFAFTNTFSSAGSFPYECTDHVLEGMTGTITVAAANPTPTVSITNPVNGAAFIAPANVTISASASVSNGTVTNVALFTGATLLGSAQSPPFTITAQNLGAGSYALTAVATAAGVSATSAVVNITVVSPVLISNSAPTVANNQFTFSYTANPGLTYVVQNSSDLINWVSLSTNVALSSSVAVTNVFAPLDGQFYRVELMPNP